MTKIISSADCGSSPKYKFVENLEVAFAQRDTAFLLQSVTDDIHWNMVGEGPIRKDALSESIECIPQESEVTEITIHHVATHGKVGAVSKAGRRAFGACLVCSRPDP